MYKFDLYIYLIFIIKLGFILLASTHIYLKVKGESDSDLDKKILYWKERVEFIFILLMALLLIYLFSPRNDRNLLITYETKILLYLFGFILLITADWKVFFHESPFFKMLQKIV